MSALVCTQVVWPDNAVGRQHQNQFFERFESCFPFMECEIDPSAKPGLLCFNLRVEEEMLEKLDVFLEYYARMCDVDLICERVADHNFRMFN